ncbi:MAG: DUF21 domain-containing protein, partial [Myxococcales bacterium]|nr:DUF21 domain-containing protein [Myxococcales bacterium]
AILSLNTIAHTVGAAGAGAQAQAVFGDAWITASSAVLTVLILVFSEIIPKTLGAAFWRQLAPLVASTLTPMMVVMYPFVRLSEAITRLVSGGHGHGAMSREEFEAMADVGREHGVLAERESLTIKNLFEFADLQVQDALTPRTVLFTFPADQTVGGVIAAHSELPYARIPLRDPARPEHTEHYVLRADVLSAAAHDEHERPLRSLARPLRQVTPELGLADLLQTFQASGEHIAAVKDEYGGLVGVISLEDVIESLLGIEIVDEVDKVSDLQAWARTKALAPPE